MSGIWPTLPPEAPLTRLEEDFIDNSPEGLWPDNQDSNVGQIRAIATAPLQECLDFLDILWREMFVLTSERYLNLWEEEVGLPPNPTGRTLDQRRAAILARLRKGPWTRKRREAVVRQYLEATIGQPIMFVPEGVPFDAGGLPFYGEGDIDNLYRIYEDVQRFAYKVKIANTNIPGSTMQRELERLHYSGLTLVYDTSEASPLDYEWDTYQTEPIVYYRFGGNLNDSMRAGRHLTNHGVATYVAGLLTDDANQARDFDGAADYADRAHDALMNVGDVFTLEAMIRPDAIPAAGTVARVISKGTNAYAMTLSDGARVRLSQPGGVGAMLDSSIVVATGNPYFVHITKNGPDMKIYINNVDRTGATIASATMLNNAEALTIGANVGGGSYFNGAIDEVAIYNRVLSQDERTRRFKTAMNDLT